MRFADLRWILWSILGSRKTLQSPEILVWPHLGLGDQISMIPALEALATRCKVIHMPVKRRNYNILSDIICYIPNLRLHPIGDEAEVEVESVRRLSKSLTIPVLYGGHLLYNLFENRINSKGINGLLALFLAYDGELISTSLKKHLLSNATKSPRHPDSPYRFIDHHPGTEREIPVEWIDSGSEQRSNVFNSMALSFSELPLLINGAAELHLMSSAPLCLALAADLGSSARRIRYRVGASFPLRADYPVSWEEMSVSGGAVSVVDRRLESQPPSPVERTLLAIIRWLYPTAPATASR